MNYTIKIEQKGTNTHAISFYEGDKEIGISDIWYQGECGILNKTSGKNEIIKLDEKIKYIEGIKVFDEYIGKGLGKIFIKLLFEYYKNDEFIFYSVRHPYWGKVAKILPYLFYDSNKDYKNKDYKDFETYYSIVKEDYSS